MRQIDTLIRHYLHIEPNNLNDDEWVARYEEVQWLIQQLNPKQ